ncbi:MAG: hypothetical protein GDA56_13875 [Hormoscilla sp. GM7CHS1pb]|nr:hypothetical protein [Hormoscilla sp. GM7CHS1pb]
MKRWRHRAWRLIVVAQSRYSLGASDYYGQACTGVCSITATNRTGINDRLASIKNSSLATARELVRAVSFVRLPRGV